MKYTFLLLFSILFISCGDDDFDSDPLIGNWVWVETYGGWIGSITPESSDYDWVLNISNSDIQSIRTDQLNGDTVEENCDYSIALRPTIYSEEDEYHILTGCPSIASSGEIYYQVIDDNTLSLSYNCFDCEGHTFVRL